MIRRFQSAVSALFSVWLNEYAQYAMAAPPFGALAQLILADANSKSLRNPVPR
ncbi:hypothetical protein [Mesorhizobium sp. WSM4887]|uniref:hypothetical protein n=1 Tax=Mesorhizobium sp. WSM4887 TaxID=3038543 RepID=UPI00241625A9|nr:hypothetical protein [Mesorhizobium sp. WSM4887]MDG4889827.1 hypothetical protein [Mesorhizobium sp. WSM4887]